VPAGGAYDWRVAASDFLPAFLLDAACYLAFFVLSHLVDEGGGDSLDVALVFGIYTALYAVLAPLLGRASDGRGRRRGLLLGAALQVAVPLLLVQALVVTPGGGPRGFSVSARWLSVPALAYLAVAVIAVANACFWPAFQARIGDRERDPAGLGRAIRVFNVGWTMGKALGFVAGGALYAWSPVGCLQAVAGAGVVLLLAIACDPTPGGGPRRGEAPAPVVEEGPTALPRELKRAYLLSALAANLILWGAVATLAGLAPKLLGEVADLSPLQEGLVLGGALGAQGLAFFALGDSRRWAYRPGGLLAAVPVALGGLGLLWFAQGLGLAIAAGLLLGLAQALTYAASVFYSLDFDTHRGLRTGIHEANLALGGALPILGGWLADISGELRAPLAMMLGIGLVATLLVTTLLLRAERRRGRG
jgi:MFS family permease